MMEKSCGWWLIWYLLFFCHGGAEVQLQWVVKEKVTAYGQNLTLVCPIENCCSEPAGWSVGPKAIILDVKTFSNDPKVKYHGTYNKEGFGVVIRNLSEADLNVTYRCVYGFDQSTPKYLFHGDVFRGSIDEEMDDLCNTDNQTENEQDVPDKEKENDTTATIIVVLIVVTMVVISLIIRIVAYCVYRSRRQKPQGTDEEMEVLYLPDIIMENQQAKPSAQFEPVSGTSGVGPTTFQQSSKKKPMKSNNENEGNVSTIPHESDKSAQQSPQVEPVGGTLGVGPTTFQQDQSVKKKPMKSNNENEEDVSTILQEIDESGIKKKRQKQTGTDEEMEVLYLPDIQMENQQAQPSAQVEPVSGTSGVGPTTFQQAQSAKKKPMKSNNEYEGNISTIPQKSDESDISPPSQLLRLKDQLYKWVDDTDALVVDLEKLADNLDEHFKNMSKAKVGGATGAVVGGVLAGVGFGLSFVTFGASLGLAIVGGVIGGSGGVVVSGSQINDAVLSKKSRSSAENILQKYKSRVELLMKDCVEIGTLLKDCGNVDEAFPLWVSFWGNMLFPLGSGIKRIDWDIIRKTASSAMKISFFADDAVKTEAAVTTTAFKTIGSTAGKAFHATTIRKITAIMKSGRPTKADIDRMVTEIVTNTDSLTKCRLES